MLALMRPDCRERLHFSGLFVNLAYGNFVGTFLESWDYR